MKSGVIVKKGWKKKKTRRISGRLCDEPLEERKARREGRKEEVAIYKGINITLQSQQTDEIRLRGIGEQSEE